MKFLLASGNTTGDYNISNFDISLGFYLTFYPSIYFCEQYIKRAES